MSAAPVVVLLATGDVDHLLENALTGLASVGVPPGDVVIGCLPESEAMVRRRVGVRPVAVRVLERGPGVDLDDYVPYGSAGFHEVSWLKIRLVRDLLREHDRLIYSDLDVAWLRDPRPYLDSVAMRFPIALQSEAQPVFPPKLCAGFMSFVRDEPSAAFLEAWLACDRPGSADRVDDQTACQELVESEPGWLDHVYVLPEALFPVGILHGLVRPAPMDVGLVQGVATPFVFHANWTIGTEDKRRLLELTGTWTAPEDGASAG